MLRNLSRLGRTLLTALSISACSVSTPVSTSRGGDSGGSPAPQVVVLGDSLAVSPSAAENFTTGLQRYLDQGGYRWKIVNEGVGGAVTADGVRRFDAVISEDTGILILELGANDGLRGIAVSTIEENLARIIERAQARGIRVLLCGMETPPAHGWNYTVAFHGVFPRLASRFGVELVPFLLAGVAFNPSMNGPDGIHPSAAGANQIATTVWPYLEALIVQNTIAAAGA